MVRPLARVLFSLMVLSTLVSASHSQGDNKFTGRIEKVTIAVKSGK